MNISTHPSLADEDYIRLLAFRDGLRRFLRWSAEQAGASGLTPVQHQLLLAIRGHGGPRGPTIRDVAGHLLLRHHSVVELVDRAAASGLVRRTIDPRDRRFVRLQLTPEGMRRLEELSTLHREELRRLAEQLVPIWEGLRAEV